MLLTEILRGSHLKLLKQWLEMGTKHPDDPDDKSSVKETAIEACESRIKMWEVDDLDYVIKLVPLSKLKHIQDPDGLHGDSLDILVKDHRRLDYSSLHRKHDVLPILLRKDFTVIDGYHRIAAAERNGEDSIPALVPTGPGSGKVTVAL